MEVPWRIATRQHAFPPEGKLIVLEGPDGVGKTTLAKDLVNIMLLNEVQTAYYSFPGHEERTLGHLIYDIYHNTDKYVDTLNQFSMQILHIAAQIDCIDQMIKPALKNGSNVILDRYWWSTKVYGQCARIDNTLLDALINIEKLYWSTIPDLILLVTRDVETPDYSNLYKLYMNLMIRESSTTTCVGVENLDYHNTLSTVLDHVSHIIGEGPIIISSDYRSEHGTYSQAESNEC